ncbi:MAG: hypothetical protein EBS82_04385 [Methylocystaceae bacterium]|jgi:hypothetical protein|nr:hypothetical protein [Methylocystaceae bacterium]NBT96975.1 hypothetical protein [Methylocystaceae bacterium]
MTYLIRRFPPKLPGAFSVGSFWESDENVLLKKSSEFSTYRQVGEKMGNSSLSTGTCVMDLKMIADVVLYRSHEARTNSVQ